MSVSEDDRSLGVVQGLGSEKRSSSKDHVLEYSMRTDRYFTRITNTEITENDSGSYLCSQSNSLAHGNMRKSVK